MSGVIPPSFSKLKMFNGDIGLGKFRVSFLLVVLAVVRRAMIGVCLFSFPRIPRLTTPSAPIRAGSVGYYHGVR